jgi:predicted Zn-dependent protease
VASWLRPSLNMTSILFNLSSPFRCTGGIYVAACGLAVVATLGFAPRVAMALGGVDIKPGHDDAIVEKLPSRLRALPKAGTVQISAQTPSQTGAPVASEAASSVALARAAIRQSRIDSDPRALGRAQAILAPWWDRPDAPVEIAVLQATVLQSRHEFAAAKKILAQTLARSPKQAQAWLTLATLDRLSGRYAESLKSCREVAQSGAPLYALACQLETRSMTGEAQAARTGFALLRGQFSEPDTQAWIVSLLAESEERAGDDTSALRAYTESLRLSPDHYTTIAAADLLLRGERPKEALALLASQPLNDAVLLRKAFALKQMGNPTWQALTAELRQRFAALDQRGGDVASHARERAQAALWLDDDAAKAFQFALLNLSLQKEPTDWLIFQNASLAVQSLGMSRQQRQEFLALQKEWQATGLRDARLRLATMGRS